MKILYEKFADAMMRMEALVCIAGMLGDSGSVSEPLEELLREDAITLKRCFPDMPEWLEKALEDGKFAAEAFNEWAVACGKLGFALKVATPVINRTERGGRSYSWDHYDTTWVYGDTLDEAVLRGLAWVAERRMAERRKWLLSWKTGLLITLL